MLNNQKKYYILSIFLFLITFLMSCNQTDTNDNASTASSSYVSNILINEVQSNATTGYITCDFVELYNTSNSSYTFPSKEWYITDSNGASEHIFYIPANTVISAKGFLVLLPDVTADANIPSSAPTGSICCTDDGTNIAFGLGKADSVSLFYTGSSNPNPATAVDSTSWTAHVATRARISDGGSLDSSDAHTPTPGAANQ